MSGVVWRMRGRPEMTQERSSQLCVPSCEDIMAFTLQNSTMEEQRGVIRFLQTSPGSQSVLAKFKWEQFEHPPYSPDMSPCDFHLFGPLKKTSQREALPLGRRTEGHSGVLALVTATGFLGTGNPSARETVG